MNPNNLTLRTWLWIVLFTSLSAGALDGPPRWDARWPTAEELRHISADDLRRLEAQARGGDAKAQVTMGVARQLGCGWKEDQNAATEWFLKASAQENLLAKVLIGNQYLKGEGVGKNEHQALNWYTQAADKGYAPAQSRIGYLYFRGLGVPQDNNLAAKYFLEAAQQNDVFAMVDLSWLYEIGEGVPRDEKRSLELDQRASALGSPDAISNLAARYQDGDGVRKDLPKAIELYRQAVDIGSGGAAFHLSEMYRRGRGVPRDEAVAHDWLIKSLVWDGHRHLRNCVRHTATGRTPRLSTHISGVTWERRSPLVIIQRSQEYCKATFNSGEQFNCGAGRSMATGTWRPAYVLSSREHIKIEKACLIAPKLIADG